MWILHLDRKFIALVLTVLVVSIVGLFFVFDFFCTSRIYLTSSCILLGLMAGVFINYHETKRISGKGDFLYGLRIYRYMPRKYLTEILVLVLSAITLSLIDPIGFILSILVFALVILRILSMR